MIQWEWGFSWEFLGLFRWDEPAVRDRLQQYVGCQHADCQSVGVVDETSFVKKGKMTACVQRQHCGAVGKIENYVVSVHLSYATPEFCSLVDGELFLPDKTWQQDRDRCRAAGIPDDVVYRPNWWPCGLAAAAVRGNTPSRSRAIDVNATAKRQGRSQPPTPHSRAFACDWHQTENHNQLSLETLVAL